MLSIDEFKGNAGGEKYQTILTDAKNRNIADILPNRKKSDLIRCFLTFENRKNVKYAVIDMNRYFKEIAVQEQGKAEGRGTGATAEHPRFIYSP